MGFFDLFSAEVHESYTDKIKRHQRELEERLRNEKKYSTTIQQERRNRMAEGVGNFLSDFSKPRKPQKPDFSEKPLGETICDGIMTIGSGLVAGLEFLNDISLEVIDYLESRK